jgi:hypothetical protein
MAIEETSAIAEGDPDCEHDRVFSGERHLTTIPIWFFVCSKCGRVGKARGQSADEKPAIDLPRFAQLMLDHHGDRFWVDWLAKGNAHTGGSAAAPPHIQSVRIPPNGRSITLTYSDAPSALNVAGAFGLDPDAPQGPRRET